MGVVCVGHVRMPMQQRLVSVLVAVFARRHGFMHVVVMPVVMSMRVLVPQSFVLVLVDMRLREVQHYPGQHQAASQRH